MVCFNPNIVVLRVYLPVSGSAAYTEWDVKVIFCNTAYGDYDFGAMPVAWTMCVIDDTWNHLLDTIQGVYKTIQKVNSHLIVGRWFALTEHLPYIYI